MNRFEIAAQKIEKQTTTSPANYTVGRIDTRRGGSYPRSLMRDGEHVAWVDSCLGPATVGDMTEAEARSRFPLAFAQYCRQTGRRIA